MTCNCRQCLPDCRARQTSRCSGGLPPELRISRRLIPMDPGRLLLTGVRCGPQIALQHSSSQSVCSLQYFGCHVDMQGQHQAVGLVVRFSYTSSSSLICMRTDLTRGVDGPASSSGCIGDAVSGLPQGCRVSWLRSGAGVAAFACSCAAAPKGALCRCMLLFCCQAAAAPPIGSHALVGHDDSDDPSGLFGQIQHMEPSKCIHMTVRVSACQAETRAWHAHTCRGQAQS